MPNLTDWTTDTLNKTDYTADTLNKTNWIPDSGDPSGGSILLESDDYLLLEDRGQLLLE